VKFDLDIPALNARFEHTPAAEIVRWAWETFAPAVALSSSFQTQSVPLLHIVSQVCPEMPVLFLDTGFHFPETLAFRDALQARLGLNVINVRARITQSQLLQQYGEGLYRRDPDLCCYIHKVVPMQEALAELDAWIAGVRRDQTVTRQTLAFLEAEPTGRFKIHPLLNWTKEDVKAYRQRYELPAHPLYERGYLSIGCAPCTRMVAVGEDERAGRWAGTGKQECGLHLRGSGGTGERGDREQRSGGAGESRTQEQDPFLFFKP